MPDASHGCAWRFCVHSTLRYREGTEQIAADKELAPKHVEAFVQFCTDLARDTDDDQSWRGLTVTAFPSKYTFDKKTGSWKRRANSTSALGRMYAVHPRNEERFHLRTLLCSLTGADVRQLLANRHARAMQDEDAYACICCHVAAAGVLFSPCNHKVMCRPCATRWLHDRPGSGCPNCRATVDHMTDVEPPPCNVNLLKDGAATFKEACIARGLVEDDGEWDAALAEASLTSVGSQLRHLFLYIIVQCEPDNPTALFEKFWRRLGEDIQLHLHERGQDSDENVRVCTLYAVRQSLDTSERSEKDALDKLPDLTESEKLLVQQLDQPLDDDSTLAHVYSYNMDEESLNSADKYANISKIPDQKRLVDLIVKYINGRQQMLLFVDAPGGGGKTYCFTYVLSYCRSQGLRVVAVASTGIAAIQLSGGKTVHSTFRVPVDESGTRSGRMALDIKMGTALGKLLVNDVDLFVFDEVTMLHKDIIDSIDQWLQIERKDPRPFGGVHVVFAGDYRQTLPIVRRKGRAEQVSASVMYSASFASFSVAHLHTNMRVEACKASNPAKSRTLEQWGRDLLMIGNGSANHQSDDDAADEFITRVPDILKMQPVRTVDDVRHMINSTFGDLSELSSLNAYDLAAQPAMHSAILCPMHESVDYINATCLDMWNGDAQVKHAVDQYTSPNDAYTITLEQLNARTPRGSPPQRLELKVGMPLIMLRNMTADLMNGTRLLLLEIRQYVLKCSVLTGGGAGKEVYIPRITFVHKGPDQPLEWKRRQFPVKPCWAMTINKSQSQTFEKVAVCLVQVTTTPTGSITVDEAEAFSHGQLYVALSRCGDPDNVCLYTTVARCTDRTARNVVYNEALSEDVRREDVDVRRRDGDDLPADVRDDDVMYEPRAHLTDAPPFDVPFHGYVFEHATCDAVQWDGSVSSIELLMNCADAEFDRQLEDWMNYDECDDCVAD